AYWDASFGQFSSASLIGGLWRAPKCCTALSLESPCGAAQITTAGSKLGQFPPKLRFAFGSGLRFGFLPQRCHTRIRIRVSVVFSPRLSYTCSKIAKA